MPIPHWTQEWLDLCSQRTYPFAAHATRVDTSNSVKIPDTFLLELYFPVTTAVETLPDRFYLKTLTLLGGGITLEIAYNDGVDNPVIATTSVATASAVEYGRYALTGLDDFDNCVGKIVIGSLAEINALPAGVYEFTPDAGALDPDTIRPSIRGVTSLAVETGGARSAKLRNNVVLSAGSNVRLTTVVGDGDPKIFIHAIPGEGFSAQCACADTTAPCIRQVNGLNAQNLAIIGDDCITATSVGNAVQLQNPCSTPCCSDTEMDEVLKKLSKLESELLSLKNFAERMQSAQSVFELKVLASRLGTSEC
jgi:hypothetical protein